MSFFLFPRIIFKTKSEINGKIIVKEQFGHYTLYVQDLIQSGGIIKDIWKKPIKKIKKGLEVKNCLVLGLGGGTLVQLIKARWPEAKITGIEIDPEIVKIGKQFFHLDKIDNLEMINQDAFSWLAKSQDKKFDLILVDFYLGYQFPQQAEGDEFIKKLKKILTKKGLVVFNRLRLPDQDLTGFEKKLGNHFSQIETLKTPANLFFLARS